MSGKSKRGFASMSQSLRSAIASKGGITAHKLGRAHTFSHDEAVEAGKIGGRISSKLHTLVKNTKS